MSKHVVFAVCVMSLLFSGVDAQDINASCVPAVGAPLNIGAVFPSDGLFTAEATDPSRGVQTMVEAVNACGGVNGRPINLIYIPASNRAQARAAIEQLTGEVPLVIGSGSLAVSEALVEASAEGAFLYWEVSEALDHVNEWTFSPRPTNFLFGMIAAGFINGQIPWVLDDGWPRIALIYENRPRAQSVADGIIYNLDVSPIIEYNFTGNLADSYDLAIDIREDEVNMVVVVAFENDIDQLWYDMREANANVKAWLQVGGERYRRDTCQRLGNTDGLISISTIGPVDEDYRMETVGTVYEQYKISYLEQFDLAPSEQANLAASGTYLLLKHVLPNVTGDFTSQNIRDAIYATETSQPAGLMGEGLYFLAENTVNFFATAIAQQRQHNQFCTIWPSDIATCAETLQPFPDWRTRVSQPEYATC